MPIKRAPRKQHFTIIPNQSLEDDGLSFKARGLLAFMLSKSDDWEFYERELIKHTTDGRDAVRSALRELANHGYLVRKQGQKPAGGGFTQSEWTVFDTPQLPLTENPSTHETAQPKESANNGEQEDPARTENARTRNAPPRNPPLPSTDLTKNLPNQETTTTTATRAGSLDSIKTFAEKNGFGDLVPDPSNRVWANLNDFLSEFVEHGASEAQARGLVLNALNDAISHNARTYAYATKILNRYSNSHFTSVEQAEAAAKAYQAAHSKQPRSKQGPAPYIEHERDDIDDRIMQEMADRQARIESGQETLPDDLPF